MKYRLTRLNWLYTDTPVYFVTACTHQRRALLANAETHHVFRKFCEEAENRGALVGRYVLMPDHFHLFVCIPPSELSLSVWVKALKNSLSKHWREKGEDAPHWQKGFFDHLVRSHESHAQKWSYVRGNPVRAKLVADADQWPFAGQIMPDLGC